MVKESFSVGILFIEREIIVHWGLSIHTSAVTETPTPLCDLTLRTNFIRSMRIPKPLLSTAIRYHVYRYRDPRVWFIL